MENEHKRMPGFIIVDDDEISNIICEIFLKELLPETAIRSFTDPEGGLRFIVDNCNDSGSAERILILDINMPKMSGWQLLDELSAFYQDTTKCITKIYMLSSSVDPLDKQKSNNHPLVSGYIEKPLSLPKLQAIFSKEVITIR